MKADGKKALTLKTMNKSNVWDIQENDIIRLLESIGKDADLIENLNHYFDIIRSAFELEEVKIDRPEVIKKYEDRGFKVATIKTDDKNSKKIALKKKTIMRVTDLTYENIRHISAAKLMEVIDRNFGGGWDSLSQSTQDIIQSGFDISTTTLPKDRLHKKGGMYEKKVEDGFDVLEIPKGAWTEAIFAKLKPLEEKPHLEFEEDRKKHKKDDDDDDEYDDDDDDLNDDKFDDEDEFDDDKLTEESYRTTIEEDPEELSLEAEDVADDDEY
mgnify:CR=1 FL=1